MSDDGGSAFPIQGQTLYSRTTGMPTQTDEGKSGMSLRDWFAGKALSGFVSAVAFNQEAEDMMTEAGLDPKKDVEKFVGMLCYDFADAMIEEKRKRERNER